MPETASKKTHESVRERLASGGQPPVGQFELLAISLLVSTPSRIGRNWTDGDDRWRTFVNDLPFSDAGRTYIVAMVEGLTQAGLQEDFRDVVNILSNEYGEPEPHPADPPAAAIITAMRRLDGTF
jgi:hypothetical protein